MDRENRTAHKADVQRVSEEHDLDKQKRKSRNPLDNVTHTDFRGKIEVSFIIL